MYKAHWLPIERAAADSSIRSKNSNIAEILENMFKEFLSAQPEKVKDRMPQALTSGQIGGELYPRFRKWFVAAMVAQGASETAQEQEHKTTVLLERIGTFAMEHFNRQIREPLVEITNADSAAFESVNRKAQQPTQTFLWMPSLKPRSTAQAAHAEDSDEESGD